MSVELSYQTYDDKSLIVFGDRRKFQKQINLLGGRWNSRKEGWLLPIVNRNKLEHFISSLTSEEKNHEKTYHREESESESNESEIEDIVLSEKLPEIEPNVERPDDDENSRQSNQSLEKLSNKGDGDEDERRLSNKRDEDERRLLEYRRRDEENRLRERQKREEIKRREEENHAKRKYGKQDPMVFNRSFKDDGDSKEDNPYEYYKSFNKKPIDFRKMHDISDSEDESDSVEESSDEYSDSSSDGFPSPSTPRRREDYKKPDTKTYNEIYNKVQDLQRRITEMEISNKRRR